MRDLHGEVNLSSRSARDERVLELLWVGQMKKRMLPSLRSRKPARIDLSLACFWAA
jgi:hypothetical protein